MDTSRDDNEELVTALLTASRSLVGVSARSLADIEDRVTLGQFRTLVVLDGHGPTRLNQLAQRLGVGPSTALRTVDRLIEAGLVDRRENEHDRREVIIRATASGREVVALVTERRRRAIADIVRRMPATEHRVLVDALLAFTEAAGEPRAGTEASSIPW
ncbi:MAG: MarR family transcriptional regulator [Nocardioides sp.]|uniref:MarR family winged helix-turn-helix transcriptional regulator n=1 Tax=Nocardioides sp. TaxID=35761 RepID=UPI0039E5B13A